MSRPLRIALVDDQDLVRTGFRMILDAQRDMCVVGQASDGVGALSMVRTTRPDVVLMDIRMPALDGIAATRAVLEADPGIKVIVLTTFDLDDYLVAAMRAGASGFLLKDTTAPELIAGIRAVARGDSVVAPSATRRLLERWFAPPASADSPGAGAARPIDSPGIGARPADPPEHSARAADSPEHSARAGRAGLLAVLSDREKEILTLVGRAMNNREIAGDLFLAESTIKSHINRMLRKLNLRDRAQLIVLAYESGLVRAGEGPAPVGTDHPDRPSQ
ncbi:response regulator transcription factor [Actinomyces dentalis]|uniref:response regulator transcription factor n=1 Tax=Actinomyces dentalis TaxID=272548 RepID=UPI00040E51E8|nr:response regulator transcription factor [Actinomyces dentalis]